MTDADRKRSREAMESEPAHAPPSAPGPGHASEAPQAQDAADFTCPICLDTLDDPTTLACCRQHVCLACLRVAAKTVTGVARGAAVVLPCPLCRAKVRIVRQRVNAALAATIRATVPAHKLQALPEPDDVIEGDTDVDEVVIAPTLLARYAVKAEAGDVAGQYAMGWCLMPTKPRVAGVTANRARARRLLTAAAAKGHAHAMRLLAMLSSGATALEWWTKAVAAGNRDAIGDLAYAYRRGMEHVPIDDALAAEWTRRGAEAGLGDCMYWLAQDAAHGVRGMAKDEGEARRWLEASVAKEYHWACEAYVRWMGAPAVTALKAARGGDAAAKAALDYFATLAGPVSAVL